MTFTKLYDYDNGLTAPVLFLRTVPAHKTTTTATMTSPFASCLSSKAAWCKVRTNLGFPAGDSRCCRCTEYLSENLESFRVDIYKGILAEF